MLGHFRQRGHRIGLCWAILVVFCGFCWPLLGKSWDHIGLILGHFGLCWDILGNVGTILGSCWAILRYFRICVGLCFGLGHFVHARRLHKTPKIPGKNTICGLRCWWFLLLFFVFVSFLGHAAVRLCLPDLGLGHVGPLGLWAILLYSVVCVLPLLSHFRCILWFVGKSWDQILLVLGHVGTFSATWAPYCLMLSHFRCILWFVLAFVGQELGPD